MVLMNTYHQLPVTFTQGKGVWLWDTEGRRYLDAISSMAVCGLGHTHPEITEAIQQQAARLIHCANLYHEPHRGALAEQLTRLSGLDQVFLCNSGAEANEAAIKLARLYGHEKGIATPKIVVMTRAFHGRTLATLAASDNPAIQTGFEPLTPGFIRAPYNDLTALHALAADRHDIAAVLLEPIQGEGGVIVPNDHYLSEVRTLCDRQGWLMMVDEIQTGLGRTGTLFAYQAAAILPDVMLLAKGIANGLPMGACLAKESVARLFQPGKHGSTFGGNPLVSAAALATLAVIERDALWEKATQRGDQLQQLLKERLSGLEQIVEIRGRGLLIGVELKAPCPDLSLLSLKEGLLMNVTRQKVVRLLPPLVISPAEIDLMVECLGNALSAYAL